MWPIGTCSSLPAGIERRPHRARDLAVQRRHGVGAAAQLQRQHRHAERLAVVVRVDPAERHELVRSRVPSASRSGPRCSSTSSGGKRSWPAGTGVWVVKTTCARHAAERLPGVDAFGLHPLAHQLERGERAVAFVEVHDARRDAQRRERPHAADAEQQLLADADAIVAAVEPRGQLAILGLVALDVRVEQQQRVAPDRQLPDARGDRAGAGLDRDRDRLAVARSPAGSAAARLSTSR